MLLACGQFVENISCMLLRVTLLQCIPISLGVIHITEKPLKGKLSCCNVCIDDAVIIRTDGLAGSTARFSLSTQEPTVEC